MHRTLVAVPLAVVGALLVGGAVTGTTLALWQDTEPLNRGSLSSGTLGLTVNGASAVQLASLPGSLQPDVGEVIKVTLQNSAPATAKNMRAVYFLDAVTSDNSALNGAVQVDARRTYGTTCAAATSGFKPVGTGYTSTRLTSTPVSPQATATICLTFRLPASAPASSRGQTGGLTLTFRGQQDRS